jgi:nucleoside 2-deoxyribosyltransferase
MRVRWDMKIYLAGPISGNGYWETLELFQPKIKTLEHAGYTVLHPLLGKGHLRNEVEFRAHGYGHPVSTNHAIFERDRWMVGMADIVFADLSHTKCVSIGTMFELAWASQLGKHTVLVLPDSEEYHQHCFVFEAADVHVQTVDEALKYLVELGGYR